MFGFSIQKLMVLAAIIGAVWYGFKLVGRLQAARDADAKTGGPKQRRGLGETLREMASGRHGDARTSSEAEDMIQCPKCDAYVSARGATACGRSDCPY